MSAHPTTPELPAEPLRSLAAMPSSPLIEAMLARHDMTENLYKKMEEHLPCEPMDDGMLARMNDSLGFSGDHAKTRDYRPYCVRKGCSTMPRMMRDPKGFRCWQCGNVWDLTENVPVVAPATLEPESTSDVMAG